MLGECPIGDQIEGFGGDSLAPVLPVEPIERLPSPELGFQQDAHLADAAVRGRQCDRESEKALFPTCQPLLNPLSSLRFRHRFGHHRESGNIRVLARLGDVNCVLRSKWSQQHALPGNRGGCNSHNPQSPRAPSLCIPQFDHQLGIIGTHWPLRREPLSQSAGILHCPNTRQNCKPPCRLLACQARER